MKKGKKLGYEDIINMTEYSEFILEPLYGREEDLNAVDVVVDTGTYNNGQKWVFTKKEYWFPDDFGICNIYEIAD